VPARAVGWGAQSPDVVYRFEQRSMKLPLLNSENRP
jgi:hypothetical protein